MADLTRFWQALEALPTLAAVQAEWHDLLGDGLAHARPLLRLSAGRVESFPRPAAKGPGLPYRVVRHSPDDVVAVCQESGDTIPIRAADVIGYELDRNLLGTRVAKAMGLATRPTIEWHSRVGSLGDFTAPRYGRRPVFLAIPRERSDVHSAIADLVAQRLTPFTLFVPTNRLVGRVSESIARVNGSFVLALEDVLQPANPGFFTATEPLETTLDRLAGRSSLMPSSAHPQPSYSFLQIPGRGWDITFAGRLTRCKDRLGMRYIAYLVSTKRREIPASALRAITSPGPALKRSRGQEVLDDQALQELRRRYEDLKELLEVAERVGDGASQERYRAEMIDIGQALRSARGLGGRPRHEGDESEKDRKAVTNAIDRAIESIQNADPHLSRHLDTFIRRGGTFAYDPDPDIDWQL